MLCSLDLNLPVQSPCKFHCPIPLMLFMLLCQHLPPSMLLLPCFPWHTSCCKSNGKPFTCKAMPLKCSPQLPNLHLYHTTSDWLVQETLECKAELVHHMF